MRSISASRPALLPALAFLVGGVFPVAMPVVSLPLLGALSGLGVALGGEGGALVAFLGAGALNGAVRSVLPRRALPPVDSERPVEAVVDVVGHATRSAFGWTQPVRVRTLRQGTV